MKAARFEYARPGSCLDAARLLHDSGGMGKVLSGGQSLGAMMNLRLAQPELLVDVRAIDALGGCVVEADAVTLGANTTHAAIEDGRVADPTGGLMPYVAAGIAYRAVRNRGTLGGSLAHADPAADWVNLMALLGAQCRLEGLDGARSVDSTDWMAGAFTTALREDEILTTVRIPRLSPTARWSYYKVNRKTGEFAEAIAAIIDDPARAVRRGLIGATEAIPYVFPAADLIDRWDAAVADTHLQAAGLTPDTYEYRIHETALRRAIAQLAPLRVRPT
jgi:aerobic carbon-monoxide dehydrogenase medium subunit